MAQLDMNLSSCCCDCMSKGHLINILENERKEAIKNYFQEESSLTNESNLSDEDELPFPTDGSQQLSSHQVHMHLKVSRLGNNSWNILKRIDANYVSVDCLLCLQVTKKKNLTLTCPELNNVTFTNAPPFDVLGIPDGCGSTVQVINNAVTNRYEWNVIIFLTF